MDTRSFVTYYTYLHRFLRHIGKDPVEVLAWAENVEKPYEVLDEIQNFVVHELKGFRYKSKVFAYTAVRSFFMHNRVDLPVDRSFKIRGDAPPVERKLSLDDLRSLIGLATQPMRSMILVKWMGLMDNSALVHFCSNYAEKLTAHMKANPNDDKPLRVDIPRRKGNRNVRQFYCFIGHDALTSLREYFNKLDEQQLRRARLRLLEKETT